MNILGTTNPLLKILIDISKIEQKMKKIKWQICRKFIWSPCEPLITIIKANSSKKWERYNDEIVKPFCSPCELLTTIMEANSSKKKKYTMMSLQNPFCIPLWAFNNNLYKQIQTKDEKNIVMRLQNLCELLIANLHEQIWI